MAKKPFRVHGVSNSLWNEDLAPIAREDRTWGAYQFGSLWVAMSVCIPTYMLASGLIAAGMSWKQALGTILLGNVIVLIPMILNAHAGAKYGIPFPVYVRASFGVLGANVPAVLRALVACGWFGIQCWIGGLAIFSMVKVVAPGIAGDAVWYCFAAFWLLNMLVVVRGIETIKAIQAVGAPFMLIVGLALLFWMVGRAGGFGVVLASAAEFQPAAGAATPNFWKLFVPSLTGIVGFWATVALNIPDFTRYARSQKAQMVGQALGLPPAMTLYSFIGIAVTAATVIVTPNHKAIWNPIDLIASFHQPVIAMIGLVALLLATLNTNVAANVVSPSNDFSNLKPSLISFKMGGLITGVLGVLCMPWRLAADPDRYINGWLVGYSGLLGPIAGVMIVDYFIVRRRSLDVEGLYVRGGQYEYVGGFNLKAIAALVAGVVVALVGLFVAPLHWLYEYAWFVGFGVAGGVYLLLMSGPTERAVNPPTPLLIPVRGFGGEGA
ncbi:NCS1 family nucleobase:cation symporter-1 [Granulicella arctica]|uniref:NCS1 family nucleobase:cation symporter-1 n=1 Tax=Granulicella arctica TaxID=940613 RepID=A0A7Y9THP6_9BACT|nr:NCS1 family nucleobase:cation symporter-1 [Granulicella arctica]NYF80110.1 NCS1 family nucleobase:cation symporter-1 [Granulicella arctica]